MSPGRQCLRTSPKSTLGRTPSLRRVRSRAAAVINHEMLLAPNSGRSSKSTRACATPRRSPPSGRSAACWIVHLSGSKASGLNVQLRADRMEPVTGKFIARKSAHRGEFKHNLQGVTVILW